MGRKNLKLYCGVIRIFYPNGPVGSPYTRYAVVANQEEARKKFEEEYFSLEGRAIRLVNVEEVTVRGYRISLEKLT